MIILINPQITYILKINSYNKHKKFLLYLFNIEKTELN